MPEVFGFNQQDADNILKMIGGSASQVELANAGDVIFGIFGFTLTTVFSKQVDVASLRAQATITDVFRQRTLATNAFVWDPTQSFISLPIGHFGLCIRWAQFFIAIQASCPAT